MKTTNCYSVYHCIPATLILACIQLVHCATCTHRAMQAVHVGVDDLLQVNLDTRFSAAYQFPDERVDGEG